MENLKIENASIIYKNFSGTRDEYHPGRRTFHVILDEDEATALEADGWNVRHKPSKADPSVMFHTLPVEARFDNYPPKIVMIGESSKKVTFLDETTVGQLDSAAIKTIDLMLSPSKWTAAGRTGIKAYLKTAYVTIEEDDLDLKYAALLEDAMSRAGEFNPAPGDDDENVPF